LAGAAIRITATSASVLMEILCRNISHSFLSLKMSSMFGCNIACAATHGSLALVQDVRVSADSDVTTPTTHESAASHSSGRRGFLVDFRESPRANPGVHGGRRGAQRGSRILPHVHARARRTID